MPKLILNDNNNNGTVELPPLSQFASDTIDARARAVARRDLLNSWLVAMPSWRRRSYLAISKHYQPQSQR